VADGSFPDDHGGYWVDKEFSIPTGDWTIRWEYTKKSLNGYGGFLDDVKVVEKDSEFFKNNYFNSNGGCFFYLFVHLGHY